MHSTISYSKRGISSAVLGVISTSRSRSESRTVDHPGTWPAQDKTKNTMKLDIPDVTNIMPMVSAVSWVALSLICALCKVDLQDHSTEIFPGNYGFEMPLSLCLLEFIICSVVLDIKMPSAKGFLNEGVIICILAQLGGSFLENVWFSSHRMPSLVYSVGYFDPIITLILAKICLDYTPTPIAAIGLASLTFGACCFSSHHLNLGLMDKSGFIICCLVIFIAIRNISIKSLQDEGVDIG
ncbi:hypothetical protein ScPMuIL_001325 [Solemya velum]